MVYRLPTQLESFIPPPASQSAPDSAIIRPWRGSFFVSGMRASDIGSNQEIQITAVETDGDIQSHLWPSRLIFSITVPHALPILGQLQNFLKARTPPVSLSTFLPERLRDPNANAVNQTNFRSLSRLLWDSQLVAIVPLPSSSSRSPSSPHASAEQRQGMLIFPASHSSAMLLGAVFMGPHEELPDFVLAARGATQGHSTSIPTHSTYGSAPSNRGETSIPISPTVISSQARQYHQHQLTAATSQLSYSSRPSHSAQAQSSSHRSSYPTGDRRQSHSVSPISPTDQPTPHYSLSAPSAEREHRQSQVQAQAQAPYRYVSPVPMMMSSQRSGYTSSGEYSEATNPYASTSSSGSYPAPGPSESSSERHTGYTYPTSNRGVSGNNPHTGYGQ